MKCPFNEDKDFDCPYVDTSGMTKDWNCDTCIHNLDYADKITPQKKKI